MYVHIILVERSEPQCKQKARKRENHNIIIRFTSCGKKNEIILALCCYETKLNEKKFPFPLPYIANAVMSAMRKRGGGRRKIYEE